MVTDDTTKNGTEMQRFYMSTIDDLEMKLLRLGQCIGKSTCGPKPQYNKRLEICYNCERRKPFGIPLGTPILVGENFRGNQHTDMETKDSIQKKRATELNRERRRTNPQLRRARAKDALAIRDVCTDIDGDPHFYIVILIALCKKLGFVVKDEHGRLVYDRHQPHEGFQIDLPQALRSLSHHVLSWVKTRRRYQLVRFSLLNDIIFHVDTVKKDVREFDISVNFFNPLTVQRLYILILSRVFLGMAGASTFYEGLGTQWKTWIDHMPDGIELIKNTYTKSILIGQQLACLAHGEQPLTKCYWFDDDFVKEQAEIAQQIYDVYKECCLRVVDTVMSAKGRSHAFQKFYDLIEKESGGRIDSKCRDLYFQCLLSVDDVSCRKKTSQAGNSATISGTAPLRCECLLVDVNDDKAQAASKFGAANLVSCFTSLRGLILMNGHNGTANTYLVVR